MALTLSAVHHKKQFDFVIAEPKNQKWHFDPELSERDRKMKALRLLGGQLEGADADSLFDHANPIAVSQRTQDWFIARSFSFASSVVASVIKVAAKDITASHDLRSDFELVLEHAGLEKLLPKEDEQSCSSSSSQSSNDSEIDSQNSSISPKAWVATLHNPESRSEAALEFRQEHVDKHNGTCLFCACCAWI